MKIGFTADSSSGIEYAFFKSNAIITRTTIRFGDKTYVDGVDMTSEDFYRHIEQSSLIPTTSAPMMGEIINRVETLKKNGYTDVIHFCISTNLSEYGKNIEALVQNEVEGINFRVCDTKSATIIEGLMVQYAEYLSSQGFNVEEIIDKVQSYRQDAHAYFLVDDLKYLVKNGRLSNLSGTIGTLMKIKPILELTKEGRISPKEKIRTHEKAVSRMIEIVLDDTKDAKDVLYVILHTNRYEQALNLKKQVLETMSNAKGVVIETVVPTIGAHIGSGVLGIGYVKNYPFVVKDK